MALEDFTTYTEVDNINDRITVDSATKITHRAMRLVTELTLVYKDFTAAYFGNFEHLVKNTITVVPDAICACWGLANRIDKGCHELWDDGEDCLLLEYIGTTLYLVNGSTSSNDSMTVAATTYYHTIERRGTTLTCKVYSDSGRTTLLDTLVVTCDTTTFRYCFPTLSPHIAGDVLSNEMITEDLVLGESVRVAAVSTALFGTRIGVRVNKLKGM